MATTKTDRLGDRIDAARRTVRGVTEQLGDVAHDAQEKLTDAGSEARARSQEVAAVARTRAAEAGTEARGRAEDLVRSAQPAGHDAAESIGDLVAAIVTALAAVPTFIARLLRLGTVWVDRAAEQGRQVADRVEPSRRARRRSHLRTAAWAGGGFGLGFAVGWVAHQRMQADAAADADAEAGADAGGTEPHAKVLEARRRAESDAG